MHTVTPLIEESERLIERAIAYFGLSVKPEQILVTIQSQGKKSAYGWYAPQRWQNGTKKAIHEINLSAEHLKTNDAAKTLLHELAHAENDVLGIKDTAGARHNKKFKAMAERLGLIVADPVPTIGYSVCTCGPDAKAFLKKITFKHKLFALSRLGDGSGAKAKQTTRMVKVVCPDCGYTVRTSAKWIEQGTPTCCCGTEMEAAE